jgi:hypothetical protein
LQQQTAFEVQFLEPGSGFDSVVEMLFELRLQLLIVWSIAIEPKSCEDTPVL